MRINSNSRRKKHISLLVILGVTMLFFGVSQAFAYWTEPDLPAPDSSVGYPIFQGSASDISSLLSQTKTGGLTIGPPGTLDISGGLNTSTVSSTSNVVVDSGQLCLNGLCISSWGAIAGGYVHLSPISADAGTLWVQSNSSDPALNSKIIPKSNFFGVRSIAAEPSPAAQTAGIAGDSSDQASPPGDTPTYGIGGVAVNISFCVGGSNAGEVCTANSDCTSNVCTPYDKSTGVWGSNGGNANAWAGRFDGRVGVEGELCINGDCRDVSNWGPPGGYNDYVRVQDSGDPIFQSGLVKIQGTVKSGQFVLGAPTASTSILLTCGDNLCNYGENGENIVNCAEDCS
ncbi:MAG: hypothetical protein H6760_00855 [Candidatus Nomurabacteria bacterium]|nr:MAG: hypothetical protein H6760_00855 [Candidatus Nomurabacteria bacterium]